MKAEGRVFKFGSNVDTDVIIPARYLNVPDPEELAKHCMEDIDREFVNKVNKGDIIVADKNFGCGSSREHAPIAIKAAGVSCVIAETFARIFYEASCARLLPASAASSTSRLSLETPEMPSRPDFLTEMQLISDFLILSVLRQQKELPMEMK